MFKDRFLEALKGKQTQERPDEEMSIIMAKIHEEKRLSSEEFSKVYDSLWKEGPAVKYRSPDAWSEQPK